MKKNFLSPKTCLQLLAFSTLLGAPEGFALDHTETLIKAGNTKISQCTSAANPEVTAEVYTNVDHSFTTWYDSKKVIYLLFSTTATKPPLGEREYLVEFEFQGTGHGTALWTVSGKKSSTEVQFEDEIPLTMFDLVDAEEEWLKNLDIWKGYEAAFFRCKALWDPSKDGRDFLNTETN